MTTNLYRQLRELLPEPTLSVATVVAEHADGSTTVQYPGGSQQRVRGAGHAAGQSVFVRSGQIEGTAPALDSVTIEV